MKKINPFLLIGIIILLSWSPEYPVSKYSETQRDASSNNHVNSQNMKLGAFSISLNVKDLKTSKQFYENLGFKVLAGDMKMNYLIMKNEHSLIGLFQGIVPANILTFNPGWDQSGKNIESFEDVREIQHRLKEKGIKLDNEVAPNTKGPGSIIFKDPDGNMIYIDQHR